MELKRDFEYQGIWLFRYRGILPLIILLMGIGLFSRAYVHPEPLPLESIPLQPNYEYFCLFIGIIGFAIRAYTVGYTPDNTSGRNVKKQIADSLNTTGAYSIIRHPLYLGNFFMWLAPALLIGNLWFVLVFILVFWLYYERIMYAEEQFLSKKFGSTFYNWAKITNAFFPKFNKFIKPNNKFNWKKVILKEKNGITALILIFTFFDILKQLMYEKNFHNYTYASLSICMLIIYGVLKYLKHRGNEK